MYKVILALALVAAVSAELSCDDCSSIADMTSNALSSKEGIQGELDLITKHVCAEAPNQVDCEEKLPAFWGAIAVSLFNPENGWFAADNICMDSCGNSTQTRAIICHECTHVLDEALNKMQDEEIQLMVVEKYINSDFCSQFDVSQDMCEEGLATVLPVAMQTLSGSGHHWVHDFCNDPIGCVNHDIFQKIAAMFY